MFVSSDADAAHDWSKSTLVIVCHSGFFEFLEYMKCAQLV